MNYPTGVDTTFGYDFADRLTGMADSTGTTTWGYNNAYELTSFTSPTASIMYTYDGAGRLETMVQAGLGETRYTLDSIGRLDLLRNPFNESTDFVYDDANRLTRKTFLSPSGIYETYGYDNRSRPTQIDVRDSSNILRSRHSYTYDPASNVLQRADMGLPTTTFTYDNADQLRTESRTGYSATYTYDANGNRGTKALVGGVTEVYTYDDADKLLGVTVGGLTTKSYGYDNAGRTASIETAAGITSLYYDYEDRVTRITYPGGAQNNFTYNGFGARATKTDSSGTRTYRRDGAGVTAPVLSDGQATYTPGISEKRGGISRFFHADIKNFLQQSSTNQNFAATKQYDAFGNVVGTPTGTWNGPFSYGGPFGYQSDADSGLMLLGHRYYDPSTGRFLTRDRVRDGRNWYAYCEGNPVKFADPEGSLPILLVVPLIGHLLFTATPTGEPAPGYDPNTGVQSQMEIYGAILLVVMPIEGVVYSALAKFLRPVPVVVQIERWLGDTRIAAAGKKIQEWLGPGARTITNEAGDKLFLSKDGTRRVRFDMNRPHPHESPHVDIEEFVEGRWVKRGRAYPRDAPHG